MKKVREFSGKYIPCTVLIEDTQERHTVWNEKQTKFEDVDRSFLYYEGGSYKKDAKIMVRDLDIMRLKGIVLPDNQADRTKYYKEKD